MKHLFFVLCVLTFVAHAEAYQTGPQNRANFGSAAQQAAGEEEGPRSFSNYNSRFGQGVQTQGVQTRLAGSEAKDFGRNTPQKPVGKTQAVPPKQAGSTAKPAATPPGTTSPQPAVGTAAPANADPAEATQQIQNMMKTMQEMTGGAAGQAGQNMPAGMPDISALMGGAMPTVAPAANPTAAPAKK